MNRKVVIGLVIGLIVIVLAAGALAASRLLSAPGGEADLPAGAS